jgi:hypothetical protein
VDLAHNRPNNITHSQQLLTLPPMRVVTRVRCLSYLCSALTNECKRDQRWLIDKRITDEIDDEINQATRHWN